MYLSVKWFKVNNEQWYKLLVGILAVKFSYTVNECLNGTIIRENCHYLLKLIVHMPHDPAISVIWIHPTKTCNTWALENIYNIVPNSIACKMWKPYKSVRREAQIATYTSMETLQRKNSKWTTDLYSNMHKSPKRSVKQDADSESELYNSLYVWSTSQANLWC